MVQFTSKPRNSRVKDPTRIQWPGGKTFAFTIFDDPDFQTLDNAGVVYDFLLDSGFRTTKGVWPGLESTPPDQRWGTCMDPTYRQWALNLQKRGFEIGWHGAAPRTSTREQTHAGLETFHSLFGPELLTMSQHYDCRETMYWGDQRISSTSCRLLYNLVTRWKNRGVSHGHIQDHPDYWADLCKQHIKYVRNFVFGDINTIAMCPLMPYHDPARPAVNFWFASAEGHNVETFTRMVSEENQDRLEAEGGGCIMYTHFAYGFAEKGVLHARFQTLMNRLSKKAGWFVPVRTLLDYLVAQKGVVTLTPRERASLEWRWLRSKLQFGSA